MPRKVAEIRPIPRKIDQTRTGIRKFAQIRTDPQKIDRICLVCRKADPRTPENPVAAPLPPISIEIARVVRSPSSPAKKPHRLENATDGIVAVDRAVSLRLLQSLFPPIARPKTVESTQAWTQEDRTADLFKKTAGPYRIGRVFRSRAKTRERMRPLLRRLFCRILNLLRRPMRQPGSRKPLWNFGPLCNWSFPKTCLLKSRRSQEYAFGPAAFYTNLCVPTGLWKWAILFCVKPIGVRAWVESKPLVRQGLL